MRKTTEEAARWFARMHDAGPDHPDQARFQAWLAASPVHAAEYRTYAEIWDNLESAEGTEAIADTMEHRLRMRRTVLRSSIVSWGGFESLVLPVDPRSIRTATQWTETGHLIRLHIGLEDADDLMADLEKGFARLKQSP